MPFPTGAAGDGFSCLVWRWWAAWNFSCKLFQKVIGRVSRGLWCPACNSRQCRCRGMEPGFHRTDPAVLAKRGGARRVRKPTGCFLSPWVSLSQPSCRESEPEETDQKANEIEPLGHPGFFPLLTATCGQIAAIEPGWGRAAVRTSWGFRGVFERLEVSQCLVLHWRCPSDGLGLCRCRCRVCHLGLAAARSQLTWLCPGTTSGSGGAEPGTLSPPPLAPAGRGNPKTPRQTMPSGIAVHSCKTSPFFPPGCSQV